MVVSDEGPFVRARKVAECPNTLTPCHQDDGGYHSDYERKTRVAQGLHHKNERGDDIKEFDDPKRCDKDMEIVGHR